MMKKGDFVKIQDFKYIEAGLDYDDVHNGLYFERDDMPQYCGQTVELVYCETHDNGQFKSWRVIGNRWFWSEEWLYPVEPDFLSDKDFDI
jgi:hypothetical protein